MDSRETIDVKEAGTKTDLLNPSKLIKEVKEGLSVTPQFAQATMASWLSCDPEIHLLLNGEQYHITYSDRWSREVPVGYVGVLGDGGHRTYKTDRVAEVMVIERGTERVRLEHVLEKGTGLLDNVETSDDINSVTRYQRNNRAAVDHARRLISQMFSSSSTTSRTSTPEHR